MSSLSTSDPPPIAKVMELVLKGRSEPERAQADEHEGEAGCDGDQQRAGLVEAEPDHHDVAFSICQWPNQTVAETGSPLLAVRLRERVILSPLEASTALVIEVRAFKARMPPLTPGAADWIEPSENSMLLKAACAAQIV